jgi:thioredoxin-like negative regulator of GroEL
MVEIKDIQAEDLDAEVKSSKKPAVLEFWMRSCDQCRRFKQVYEKLPEHFDGVRFYRMNMMKSIENLRLAEDLGVEQTPTTKVFCGGTEVGEIVGYRDNEEAVDELRRILSSSPECSR